MLIQYHKSVRVEIFHYRGASEEEFARFRGTIQNSKNKAGNDTFSAARPREFELQLNHTRHIA